MLLSAKLHFSKFINTVVIEEKMKKKKKKNIAEIRKTVDFELDP